MRALPNSTEHSHTLPDGYAHPTPDDLTGVREIVEANEFSYVKVLELPPNLAKMQCKHCDTYLIARKKEPRMTSSNPLVHMTTIMGHTLREAMNHRKDRPETVYDGDEPVAGWVLYEREQMTTAVNQARMNRGLSPVTLDQVKRVENRALGHIDYFEKYALGCAELALGLVQNDLSELHRRNT